MKPHRKLRNDQGARERTADRDAQERTAPSAPAPKPSPLHEEGLSVDADQLGARFIRRAAEQGNWESELEPELSLQGGAHTDEALPDADGNVWDQTVQHARSSDVRELRDVVVGDDDDGAAPRDALDEDPDRAPSTSSTPRTMDVRSGRVASPSLFDDVDETSGETHVPDVRSEDQD